MIIMKSGTTPTPKVDNGNNTATDAGNTGGGRVRDPNLANTKMFKVTGNILVAGSYCGGAAPSKEMEEEARRPKPFANQGFLIRTRHETDHLERPEIGRASCRERV